MTVEKTETVENKAFRVIDSVKYAFDAVTAQIFDKVLAERDAARVELKSAQDKILTDEQIDARVTARVEVAKVYPALDTKGKSMEYLQALLDGAKHMPKASETGESKNDRAFDKVDDKEPAGGGLKSARDKFIASGSGRR